MDRATETGERSLWVDVVAFKQLSEQRACSSVPSDINHTQRNQSVTEADGSPVHGGRGAGCSGPDSAARR